MENSFSYKKGFRKGIEIFKENKQDGYFSIDEDIHAMKACMRYADNRMKNGEELKQTQVDYYNGIADGLRFSLKQYGIRIPQKEESYFERKERLHNYGKPRPYDGFKFWE